jgi:glycosyltransferase involved in cell wall biosynthesis
MTKSLERWMKVAGECLLLPWFLLLVLGVCLPWLTVRGRIGHRPAKPRIIWGPTPIINIGTNASADRLYGYRSETLVYRPYYITKDFTYNLERWWRIKPLALVIPWAVFLWAVLRYDIFQVYYDGGFLNRTIGKRLELPLLKWLGKTVIVSAYGADVRVEKATRALGAYNCCTDCTQRLVACICDEAKAQRNLAHVHRYADLTLSMGDMIEYTPGSRNDVFYWAIDLKKWPYVGVSPTSRPVKVLHAPNHPQFKGTRFLVDCVKQLQEEGYAVELVLVQQMNNEEAMELYKQADIAADQFLIGWHGNFAVEAMALGKPVIAYLRKPEAYLPRGTDCPIVSANPDTLKSALVRLIENPALRVELGIKGRRYVEQVFSLEQVGARMDRLYQGLWNRPMAAGEGGR